MTTLINIRPWSLTLGTTKYLNFVIVRSLAYVLDSVVINSFYIKHLARQYIRTKCPVKNGNSRSSIRYTNLLYSNIKMVGQLQLAGEIRPGT